MTYRQGSFIDSTTAGATMIGIMHPDFISNGWERVETDLDSGAFRWEVYKNPAANNSFATDFFVGIARFYNSGTAGSGNANQAIYFTVFEQWNGTLKQATNFPVWSAAISGYTTNYLPTASTVARALPNLGTALPVISATVSNPGAGYSAPPTVTLNAQTRGSGATATAVMELDTVVVLAGGSGYPINQSALACTITGGGGSGAVVTATTNGSGVVTSYAIVSRGTGWTSLPTITPDTGGGGSGATTTVRLRVLSITITAGGSTYDFPPTVSFSGANTVVAVATAAADSGFCWAGQGLGGTSTQYFYTITNDMFAITARINGSTDNGGWYVGLYDRLMSSDFDPFPLCVLNLNAGTTSQLGPVDGYGFVIREPRRGPSGASSGFRHDTAVMGPVNNLANGGSLFNPLPAGSTDGYSGLPFVARASFSGRGYYANWRGLMKNIVVSGGTGTAVTGDGIYWTVGVTNYAATRVAAHTYIVQV